MLQWSKGMTDVSVYPNIADAIERYLPFVEKVIGRIGKKEDSRELMEAIKKANSYFKSGQYPEALEEYQNLAKKFPKDLRPRLGEITVLRKTGKKLRALAACGVALEVSQGDFPREAKLYHTMGMISYDLFEIYRQKTDLDETIYFFDRAKRMQDDQLVLLPLANIIECCIDGILETEEVSEWDKERYRERATSELSLMDGRLAQLPVDEKGIGYVVGMIREIRRKDHQDALTWLRPLLNSLEKRIQDKRAEIAFNDENTNLEGPSSMRRRSRLKAALAILAIVSSMAGFRFIDAHASGVAEIATQGTAPNIEEIIQYDPSNVRAKEVWEGPGLHVFRIERGADAISLTEEVHDWAAVQIQDYDIDTMTS